MRGVGCRPAGFLAGFALAGRDPGEAHQYESLALTDLGLLLRVQQIGDALLSCPLFVIEEWLESEY